MLIKVPSKDTATVAIAALTQHVGKLPVALRRSLTWDRGLEMAQHKSFTVETEVESLLLRSAEPVAARHQRKHQRPVASVLP